MPNNFTVVKRNYGHWDFVNNEGRLFRLRGTPGDWVALDERAAPYPSTRFKSFTMCAAFIFEELTHEELEEDPKSPRKQQADHQTHPMKPDETPANHPAISVSSSMPTRCLGACANHSGTVRTVRVWHGSHDWGFFDYCDIAVETDRERGFLVLEEGDEEFHDQRTPVQPTESSSIGTKLVVEGQAGEQISEKGGDEPCAQVNKEKNESGEKMSTSLIQLSQSSNDLEASTPSTNTSASNAPAAVQSGSQGQAPSAGATHIDLVEVEYIESGTFVGGEEDAFTAGFTRDESGYVIRKSDFENLQRETIALRQQLVESLANLENVRVAYKFKVAARDVEIERLNEVLSVSNTVTQHFFLDGKKHELRCNPGMGRGVKGADVRAILNTERKLYSLHFDDLPDGTLSAPIQDTTCIENGRKIVTIPEAHA